MGKNLRQQKRGKGGPRYRVPSHRYLGKITYSNMPFGQHPGIVEDITHAPGLYAPVAVVNFGGQKSLMLATEGLRVGQHVTAPSTENGTILTLQDIPEGSKISNIELLPKDGGRLCRSSGAFAILIGKEEKGVTVLLPSKQKKTLSGECLATIGPVAGAGRIEKPLMKAGTANYKWKAHGKVYPHVAGVNMNAVNHPFGGQTRPGKVKTVSHHTPPGAKVGSIAPRRTGKRKK